jgi:hypothetical protein
LTKWENHLAHLKDKLAARQSVIALFSDRQVLRRAVKVIFIRNGGKVGVHVAATKKLIGNFVSVAEVRKNRFAWMVTYRLMSNLGCRGILTQFGHDPGELQCRTKSVAILR